MIDPLATMAPGSPEQDGAAALAAGLAALEDAARSYHEWPTSHS